MHNFSDQPSTYFAPAARADMHQIRQEMAGIQENPVWSVALEALEGWMAVLNSQRQVLALNDSFLKGIGVSDPTSLLGLRLGECVCCVHAHDHPGGCGTSRYCSTCGAAIATVTALSKERVSEADCILTYEHHGVELDRDFRVRCLPFHVGGEIFLLLCMRHVTDDKRRGALERVFLHEISNAVAALSLATGALPRPEDPQDRGLWVQVRQSMGMLAEEVRIQRILSQDGQAGTRLKTQEVTTSEVLQQVELVFGNRPPYGEALLRVERPEKDVVFHTDLGLLTRVISNMVLNALEANVDGGTARLWSTHDADHVCFHVWNAQRIPENVGMRVFQRNFTTKPGRGRGLGTFTMKLLAASFLNSEVSFKTNDHEGTTFTVRIPLASQA